MYTQFNMRCSTLEKEAWDARASALASATSAWLRLLANADSGISGRSKTVPVPKGPKPPTRAEADRTIRNMKRQKQLPPPTKGPPLDPPADFTPVPSPKPKPSPLTPAAAFKQLQKNKAKASATTLLPE